MPLLRDCTRSQPLVLVTCAQIGLRSMESQILRHQELKMRQAIEVLHKVEVCVGIGSASRIQGSHSNTAFLGYLIERSLCAISKTCFVFVWRWYWDRVVLGVGGRGGGGGKALA